MLSSFNLQCHHLWNVTGFPISHHNYACNKSMRDDQHLNRLTEVSSYPGQNNVFFTHNIEIINITRSGLKLVPNKAGPHATNT